MYARQAESKAPEHVVLHRAGSVPDLPDETMAVLNILVMEPRQLAAELQAADAAAGAAAGAATATEASHPQQQLTEIEVTAPALPPIVFLTQGCGLLCLLDVPTLSANHARAKSGLFLGL